MLSHYAAPPTVARFMLDKSLVRGIVGPVGSGKTSGCIFELFRRATAQAPGPDGIRQTRFAIIRNTLQALKTTVLPDVRAYLGDLFSWKVSENVGTLSFMMKDGTKVVSEWLFIPLDEVEDVRRLLSLQLTGAWVEEFRETDFAILASLIGRVGRFPRLGTSPTWQGVILSSNPYPDGSAWHEAFEVDQPDGWRLFRQPSGLSPDAENVENLPEGYYDRLQEGASEEWVRVHVEGLNGADMSGQAVFGQVFNYDYHTRPSLSVRQGSTVIIGLDTDRNPAAVLGQRRPDGGLNVLASVAQEGIGLELFVSTILRPLLYERFASCPVILVIDPSAAKRSSITEESQLQALHRLGFDATLASTNALDPRLRAVDELLTKNYAGEPSVLFDARGCADLIRALQSNYKYTRSSRGILSPQPEKKHPWSDLADALQYLALGQNAVGRGHVLQLRRRFGNSMGGGRPAPAAAGWT